MNEGRLDVRLVGAGLARSRGEARELIAGGAVLVDGRTATKAALQVPPHARVELVPGSRSRWVGRAAGKLDAALTTFGADGLSAAGRRCLDVGASTGGFTQVLLERGADHVVALDVGHGQLVPEIAADPRVSELSGTNIRDVAPELLLAGGRFGLVVGDVSFISLRLVIPRLVPLPAAGGDVVLLVKPQFEVGRGRLDKHGVVRSARARDDALQGVLAQAVAVGWRVRAVMDSPVPGHRGNREYLGWFTAAPEVGSDEEAGPVTEATR